MEGCASVDHRSDSSGDSLEVEPGVFQTTSYFVEDVEDVEMVLDVLDGAVVRKLVQEQFDTLLNRAHKISPGMDITAMASVL
jgi:hypothetical protein